MSTTISLASLRLQFAQSFADQFDRSVNHHEDIEFYTVGDYIVVADGSSMWLALTEDFDSALEYMIGQILDGKYDSDLDPDDESEFWVSTYGDFCDAAWMLWNNVVGDGSALLTELSMVATADVQRQILEICGFDVDGLTVSEWKNNELVRIGTIE